MEALLYYGLNQMPFLKGTKYKSLYRGEDTEQIESRLEYLKNTKGIGIITGNPGSGKTAAIREFTKKLNPALYKPIYIQMSSVSINEFLKMLATGLGLEPCYKKSDLFRQIQEEIQYQVNEKRCYPVVIVDEAHYLSHGILRDLVMLLNFEMDSKDCCILILCGTSLLARNLRQTNNEALRQRILVNYQMQGLSCSEAKEYIEHCLKQCGAKEPIFSEAAIDAAFKNSQGTVRKLNNLLSKALIEGASQEKRLIDEEIIKLVFEDSELM
ncbi:AAA family ATPase [Erysipelotrichaceae bacterium RD49]|nr:AAA family ATPase [Erysipelotrichaceae bacterium RD49]